MVRLLQDILAYIKLSMIGNVISGYLLKFFKVEVWKYV